MPEAKRFKPNNSAALYLIGFGLYFISGLVVGLFEGEYVAYISYAVPQVSFICAILGYARFNKYKLNDLVPLTVKKPKATALLLCIPITVGVILQNLLFANGFQWAMEALGAKIGVTLPPLNTPWEVVASLLLVAVLPAIGEEAMYRGVLVTGMTNGTSPRTAIYVSALIFSLSHLNPAQLVHQFILGVVLALISSETGTVVYGMVIHFLNNASVILLDVFLPGVKTLESYSPQNLLILSGASVVGAFILCASIYGLMKCASQKGNSYFFIYLFARKSKGDKSSESENAGDNSSAGSEKTAKRGLSERILGAVDKLGYWTIAVVAILIIGSVIVFISGFIPT